MEKLMLLDKFCALQKVYKNVKQKLENSYSIIERMKRIVLTTT